MVVTLSHDVHWYIDEVTSRVVAKTGIPSDRFHTGKILLQCLNDAPELLLQIDGATEEKDTFKSGLERSIRCATALRNIGLKPKDVIAVMGPNCVDLPLVLYAGAYTGMPVAGFDHLHTTDEYRSLFEQCPPKAVFCPTESINNVQKALEALNVQAHIITFKKSENYLSFHEFLDKYSDNKPPEEFVPTDFNPWDTDIIIVSTSGTTGTPKITPLTHVNAMIGFPLVMVWRDKFPHPFRLLLCLSPIQWLSATILFLMSAIAKFPRVQSSLPSSPDHVIDLINKYKPSFMVSSPPFMTTLLKPSNMERCDLSSFEHIIVGGSAVSTELIDGVKKAIPNVEICSPYGMSEASGVVLCGEDPTGKSSGRSLGHFKYRLVDPETEQDVTEINKPGELWVKGPAVFKGYYNNPEANAAVFSDGWLKTGDIFYRDDNLKYYFVDRHKLLLKYKSHQISPVEIENVIITHPGVHDVVVTGIPDEAGELPMACIIPHDGYNVTAQEIKDLVKEKLSDQKQLRGGVVFVKEFPLTSTSKVNRVKLKSLVKTMQRQ